MLAPCVPTCRLPDIVHFHRSVPQLNGAFSSCSILHYLIASKYLNSSPLSITENKVGQELSFTSEDKGESSFSEQYKVCISCLMTVVASLSYLNMQLVSPLLLKTCLEYLKVNAEFLSQKGKAWDGISESCTTTLKNVSMVAEELHFFVQDILLPMECMQHASWTWWLLKAPDNWLGSWLWRCLVESFCIPVDTCVAVPLQWTVSHVKTYQALHEA